MRGQYSNLPGVEAWGKKKKKSQVWGVAMTGVGGVGQKLQI